MPVIYSVKWSEKAAKSIAQINDYIAISGYPETA